MHHPQLDRIGQVTERQSCHFDFYQDDEPMFQINFTDTSSAEMATLPKMLQIEILMEFQVLTPDFINEHPDRFGTLTREDRTLYRYRANDYRIYFEKTDHGIQIRRVLHKNTMKDFLFRTNLPLAEDEILQDQAGFWELIDSPQTVSSENKQE